MTVGQLFRGIVEECGMKMDEHRFKLADTIAPDVMSIELTPEDVERMRPKLLAHAKELLAMPDEELKKIAYRHTSRN